MKRIKIVSVIISIMLVVLALPMGITAAAATSSWDGTTTTQPTSMKTIDGVYYYEIYTAEELAYIAKTGGDWLNYNYILTDDIILNDVKLTYDTNGNITVNTSTLNKWTPIKGLNGVFDGNGFSISGVYMDSSESVAFFSSMGATVKNLNIKNSYIRSTGGSAAGICLNNGSEDIINCTFDGAVVGVNNVGGIVSSMYGYVKQSTNNGDIFSTGNYVGGIAGELDAWGIENCTNNGNVISTGNYVGGIVGSCDLYTPSGCNNTGNITGNDYVGGICGNGPDGGWLGGNNSGKITGHDYVGGLTGCSHLNNYWGGGGVSGNNTGDVTGNKYVGGLVGYLQDISLSGSNNAGNVTGNELVGGIAGHSESIWGRGSVNNCAFVKNETTNTNLSDFGNTAGEEGNTPPPSEDVWDGTILQPSVLVNVDGIYYYEIYTGKELAFIAQTGGEWLDFNYRLANDIILNDVELTYDTNGNITVNTSTLNEWTSIKGLKGIFDGNGFTISGVYMDSSESVAFFSSMGANVKNLNIKNSYIRSTGGSAAGICLNNGSEDIINCSFDGAVVGVNRVGGIVSSMNGYVKQSTNNGDIFSTGNYVGGIAGELDAWGIENCTNNGNVISTGNYVGGIVGSCDLYTPSGCNNTGNITGNDYVGGICGNGPDGGWLGGNNSGKITGHDYVGGLTGCSHLNNYWGGGGVSGNNTGDVTGNKYVGGLVGYLQDISLSGSNNAGNVTGNELVGGIAGHSESIWGRGSVSNCYFLKTSNVNTNLFAFGNTNEDADSATSKDATFFCISSDGILNQSGHKYSSTVPCDATCDNCGYERTVTHTYDNVKYDSDKHWYECDCGEVKYDSEESHTGGTATCTSKAKCDVCKQAYGALNANNHTAATSWTSTNGQHYHTCTNGCDAKLELANCADSDKDHKCDVCSTAMGTHEAASGKHTCDYCNQTVTECADSDKDHKCDVCGKVLSTVSGTDNENESSGDKVPEPDNDKPQTGCGSVIAGTSVGAIVLISIGAFVVMKKRKTK